MVCLCAALSADWPQVDSVTRSEVTRFISDQLRWLSRRIADGIAINRFRSEDPSRVAPALFHALEGATLMRRANRRQPLPSATAATILQLLNAT
jgi:hypothetical protein